MRNPPERSSTTTTSYPSRACTAFARPQMQTDYGLDLGVAGLELACARGGMGRPCLLLALSPGRLAGDMGSDETCSACHERLLPPGEEHVRGRTGGAVCDAARRVGLTCERGQSEHQSRSSAPTVATSAAGLAAVAATVAVGPPALGQSAAEKGTAASGSAWAPRTSPRPHTTNRSICVPHFPRRLPDLRVGMRCTKGAVRTRV